MHGGSARQVRARREQRILLYEAKVKASPPVVEPEPEPSADEVLIGLLRDVRRTLQQIQVSLAESPSPQWLTVLGEWLDRADRISRSVIVTRAEERIAQRRVAVTGEQVATLTTVMFIGLTSSDLSARQTVEVMDAVLAAIQRAGAGELPLIDKDVQRQWLERMRREAAAESLPELESMAAVS